MSAAATLASAAQIAQAMGCTKSTVIRRAEREAKPGPFDGLPTFKPLADDLAPQMKAALLDLRKALTEPPSLGDKFPFVMPPAVAAPKGRPSKVQPNQVVRLCRFIRLGDSVPVAAKKVGLPQRVARRVMTGQCAIAHHPAVALAGVELPAWSRRNSGESPKTAQEAPNAPSAGGCTPQPKKSGAEAAPFEPHPQAT